MKHSGAVVRLGALKLLIHRFAFTAMVVAAFGLMILGKADAVLAERLRAAITDAVTPALNVLSRPAEVIADVADRVRNLAALHAENEKLREENRRLLHWQTVARRLEDENRLLRRQTHAVSDAAARYVTARVVADTGGAFVRSVLVSAGAAEGVRKGQAVLAGEALVGRVAEVGRRSARVLLLTDLNSRIPVATVGARANAILAGDNSDQPTLSYLPLDAVVEPGQRVVTSGHGGAFPPGIPVGVVTAVGNGGPRVQPFANRHRLSMVTIADYGLDALAVSAESTGQAGEGP
ncbi:MAG: rod shape-determining protein MreC [Rhodospirillales bacterium]|nr:rod shape-determining protein MreC [Rhodospirillales bacterium]